MNAMILAAGLGTRLRPLTDTKPKALVEVAGKSLLHWVAEKLVSSGFNRIVVNIHHHADMMRDAIKNLPLDAEFIISDESGQLLDTGGGLLKAKPFLESNKAFLLYNVDILSDINLQDMYSCHLAKGGIATLATSARESSNHLLWHNNKLVGWEQTVSGEKIIAKETSNQPQKRAFSGVHVISPKIFDLINYSGKFSIIKAYLDLAGKHNIYSYHHGHKYWFDIGSIEKLNAAEKIISKNPGITNCNTLDIRGL